MHDVKGYFVREFWYERGIEHGNPGFNTRFRVNAPETSLHTSFMHRPEVRGNGMLQILAEQDLTLLAGAELYCEIWGGHPETECKRVTVNGRSTYLLPEVGTAEGHCTHQYPKILLKITDLVNGYNVFQFACDQGRGFWGHFIVDNACLRAELRDDHPDLQILGLADFAARVEVTPDGDEAFALRLIPSDEDRIAAVDFVGFYEGYDGNGSGQTRDWHGFTKVRCPEAILGTVESVPFVLRWDMSMLSAQDGIAVKAIVHFKVVPDIIYLTSPTEGLFTSNSRTARVVLIGAQDIPRPFWSRAGQERRCTLWLDDEPGDIERAELHVVVWDGGRGSVEAPFTLNGHPLPVDGVGRHDVLYRVLPIDAGMLRKGANEVRVLSDTEHHGIEVLLPGPALAVRWQEKNMSTD
jgi:hypothetical protein